MSSHWASRLKLFILLSLVNDLISSLRANYFENEVVVCLAGHLLLTCRVGILHRNTINKRKQRQNVDNVNPFSATYRLQDSLQPQQPGDLSQASRVWSEGVHPLETRTEIRGGGGLLTWLVAPPSGQSVQCFYRHNWEIKKKTSCIFQMTKLKHVCLKLLWCLN